MAALRSEALHRLTRSWSVRVFSLCLFSSPETPFVSLPCVSSRLVWSRLPSTWYLKVDTYTVCACAKEVGRRELERFRELCELLAPDSNYAGLRALLAAASPPCIPYMGTRAEPTPIPTPTPPRPHPTPPPHTHTPSAHHISTIQSSVCVRLLGYNRCLSADCSYSTVESCPPP